MENSLQGGTGERSVRGAFFFFVLSDKTQRPERQLPAVICNRVRGGKKEKKKKEKDRIRYAIARGTRPEESYNIPPRNHSTCNQNRSHTLADIRLRDGNCDRLVSVSISMYVSH